MSAPAPVSYDALCKAILKKHTIRLHTLLFLFTLLLTITLTLSFSLIRLRFSLWPVFNLWVWGYGLGMYVAVVAPLLVCRKALLTTTRKTPSNLPELLASPQNRWELMTYLFSALSFSVLFVRMLRLPRLGGDLDGKLLLYSKQTGAVVINERPVLVGVVLVVFAGVYGTLQVLLQRRAVVWPTYEQQTQPAPASISRHLTRTLFPSLRTALSSCTLTLLLYRLLLRDALSSLLLLLLPIPLLRRSIDYSRRQTLFSLPLLLKLNLACLTLALLWEVSNALFTAYLSRPLRSPRSPLLSNKLIFQGLRSPTPYIQHQAWLELSLLARSNEAAKKSLFEDMSPEYALALAGEGGKAPVSAKQGMWGAVARQGLYELGVDYQVLKRRGKPAAGPGPAAAPKPAPSASALKALPSAQALLPPPAPTPAESLLKSVSSLPLPLPSSTAPLLSSAVGEVVKRGQQIESVKRVEGEISRAGKEVGGWAGRLGRVVGLAKAGKAGGGVGVLEVCMPRREMDGWIVDSLSYLIASSPQLDKYGLSPRTAPQLLEALTSYEHELQLLLQSLHQSLALSSQQSAQLASTPLTVYNAPEKASLLLWRWLAWPGVGEDKQREEVERVVESLTGTGEAVRRVLGAYGEEVGAFRFPRQVARRLRGHVAGAGQQ